MNYRRLGRSGLQVSELSLGSWVTYHNQVDDGGRARDAGRGVRRRRQLLRQRRGLCRRQSEIVMGAAIKRAEVAAAELRRLDQVLLGPRPRRQRRQPQGHAEPQVPDAGDRRLAAALRPRLHRPRLLPPPRPEHAGRGDRLGDERHDHPRQGALLGHQRMAGRRHPRRLGDRRAPPPAQAGDGAAAVPPVPPQARRGGVRAASTTTSASASPPGARWPAGLLTGKYRERHPGRQPRRDGEHGASSRRASPTRRRTTRSRKLERDRRRARLQRRAARDRLGGEEPARLAP